MKPGFNRITLACLSTVALASLASSASASPAPRGWKLPALGGNTVDIALNVRCPGGALGTSDVESDWLDVNQAKARIDWAISCGHIAPVARKLFEFYMDPDTLDKVPYPKDANGNFTKLNYPTFAHKDEARNHPVWKPDLASCDMPDDVIFLGICTTGCYEPDQVVLFEDGYKTLPEAFKKTEKGRLLVVSEGSSFDTIEFAAKDVSYFTADIRETTQPIVTFSMASGGQLKVTQNHPLVDGNGFVKEASALKVGDSLVLADGRLDQIVERSERDFTGKVWNVAPQAGGSQNNIVVAQGYLNGSARYQDGSVKDLNRLQSRNLIDAKVFE